jgi:hypothetical protein
MILIYMQVQLIEHFELLLELQKENFLFDKIKNIQTNKLIVEYIQSFAKIFDVMNYFQDLFDIIYKNLHIVLN